MLRAARVTCTRVIARDSPCSSDPWCRRSRARVLGRGAFKAVCSTRVHHVFTGRADAAGSQPPGKLPQRQSDSGVGHRPRARLANLPLCARTYDVAMPPPSSERLRDRLEVHLERTARARVDRPRAPGTAWRLAALIGAGWVSRRLTRLVGADVRYAFGYQAFNRGRFFLAADAF